MYARIAYRNLNRTLIEEAGNYFQRSKIDPRFVVKLLGSHVRNSIGWQDEAQAWSGLMKDVEKAKDIKDISKLLGPCVTTCNQAETPRPAVEQKVRDVYGTNIVDAEQPGVEVQLLRDQLYMLARNMLLDYLRKTRASRRKGSSGSKDVERERKINVVCRLQLACASGSALAERTSAQLCRRSTRVWLNCWLRTGMPMNSLSFSLLPTTAYTRSWKTLSIRGGNLICCHRFYAY